MSDRDLLDAVESWTLARAVESSSEPIVWAQDFFGFTTASPQGARLHRPGERCLRFDAWTAALWTLLVDAELAPVDVGTCPVCRGTREAYTGLVLVQCLACTVDGEPTGRNMRDAAQLLLDAAPKQKCQTCEGRAQLAIFAEGLLKRGSDLGELLAAWLAPVESDARPQYRALLLWCVTFAAVQIAQGEQLAALGEPLAIWRWRPGIRSIVGVGGVKFRIPGLIPEADAGLRGRVLDALRESRPERITHAHTPQNKSA